MKIDIATLDRRRFLRGSAAALALPYLESAFGARGRAQRRVPPRRFACIYQPDGVPMPLREDPAFEDWAWFPHGGGTDFRLTKCLEPLAPLRAELTVVSGMSHPAVRAVHGHSNADQFLTGADTGASGAYANSISLDQVFARHVGDETRYASLVMSSDGGTGTARGAQTLSFDANGRPIAAAHRPKKIFDSLFVTSDAAARQRLAQSRSTLDELLADARALRGRLSGGDRGVLDQYLDAVRETEQKVEKAVRWVDVPLPEVDPGELRLEVTPDDARAYVQAMLGLIHLAFQTDSTRTATYQLGRENGVGISDHLGRAVGFELAHQLSHETTKPDGWKNFGIYCRFLVEELANLASRLQQTPDSGGDGNLLDNTLLLFGSASSAFHLSRNYPLILLGGRSMGFRHGQYLNYVGDHAFGGGWNGGTEPWQREFDREDRPLGELYVTMLRRLGVEIAEFAGCSAGIEEV
ncbi:MAG: DUF1552 domain-containing protein [Planctomycetes bacterium]|nr:DUF1552 domain-containing protein [Planctomycetota bacterium]